MSCQIEIRSDDLHLTAGSGEILADVLRGAGIEISLECHKRGLCGRCFIEVLEGPLPPVTERERSLLETAGLSGSFRLACGYTVTADMVLNIPERSRAARIEVLETGLEISLPLDPPVKKYTVEIAPPDLADPESALDGLFASLGHPSAGISPAALLSLSEILSGGTRTVTAVLDTEKVLSLEPGATRDSHFGLAVDVGTTTLVVEVVDVNTGRRVGSWAGANPQMPFGADVVSRISHAFRNPENLKILQKTLLDTLDDKISFLLSSHKIRKEHVHQVVFAGNTAMNHILLGLSVDSLAVSPYNAAFSCLPAFPAARLGLPLLPEAQVYMAPNIKSFVGGDISAGLTAIDLFSREGRHLFIDLGTNGEIVLKRGRKITATSTAAGPAFEGMNISAGMLATAGAVCRAERSGGLKLETIGGRPPRGVCGTGLIDLIALFLEENLISADGAITDRSGRLKVADGIFITKKDVREVQLAAAAVKTGIRMMLDKYRLKADDLDGIWLAGAFGNTLNTANAKRLGLLPDISPDRIFFVGNSALAGARAMLLSLPARRRTEKLVRRIDYTSLASNPGFQDIFIDSLRFDMFEASK